MITSYYSVLKAAKMNKAEIIELQKKIMDGLVLASQKMLEAKQKNNEKLAVYHNGKIQVIKAADITW